MDRRTFAPKFFKQKITNNEKIIALRFDCLSSNPHLM